MSSDWLPNSVCSSSRTPSGSPLMDVTIAKRSSFTWARSAPDSAAGGVAWSPAITASQTLTPIAHRSRVRRIGARIPKRRSRCIKLRGARSAGLRSFRLFGRRSSMYTTDTSHAVSRLFSELVDGTRGDGNAFILNSGDVGFLRSLDRLSPAEASASLNQGATIAAHAQHVRYGLSLM